MKIGFIGGTYNPIHLAHLRIAEEIRDDFGLDRVIFIPAASPPHKPLAGDLSFEDRCEMVRLAVADNPAFGLSRMEGERGGTSYSIDTFRALRRDHPHDELYFIMGSDSFADIGTWKQSIELFGYINFVVVGRPGCIELSLQRAVPVAIAEEFCYHEAELRLVHSSGHSVYYRLGVPLDISSSAIRDLVRRGRSIKYLVHPAVERYIKDHTLYAERED